MKLKVILLINFLILGTFCGLFEEITDYKEKGFKIQESDLHYTRLEKETEEDSQTIILDSVNSLFSSPSQWEAYLNRIKSFTKQDAEDIILNCSKGDKPNFYKFASWPVGSVNFNVSQLQFQLERRSDDCFAYVNVSFFKTSGNSYELIFEPGPRQLNYTCSEVYTIATPSEFHMIDLKKDHTFVKKKMNQQQILNAQNVNISIYRLCDRLKHVLPDIYMTLALYVGGLGASPYIPFFGSKPTWWQNELNPKFIKEANTFQWEKRKNIFVDLDDSEVHSGDFLIITRMDGLDQLIEWGSGSRSGHSVVILEIDGQMYAVESQDAWYWPTHNIQRTHWKDWKKYAKNAGFTVALLPLTDEKRKQFNLSAAVEFFENLEGTPYGYHNFIFGWLDVPDKNLPNITNLEFIYTIASMIESVYAYPIQRVFGEGLNKRLNTTNLTLPQIADLTAQRGMTLNDLFAIPEQDDWVYSDGHSYVCSAFVAGVYKAAGLFNGKKIQATEFTPRDVYQMNFYNTSVVRPQKCIDADPNLPYCQITGQFVMNITSDGYSTIDPYDNMFEKCPSEPPLYLRTPGC